VLAVAPVAAGAFLVPLRAAGAADHGLTLPASMIIRARCPTLAALTKTFASVSAAVPDLNVSIAGDSGWVGIGGS
jgi:hypothetical protein